jgi:3-hydroxybutyryl-CoA dehydrogenase
MTEVAVVGAGLMGHALALVFALGGHRVRLTDNSPATLARAPGLMAQALDLLIEGGEAPEGWTRDRLAKAVASCATLKETVAGAELVIEAIIEDADAKRALFDQLNGLMDPNAILASNTSRLDVFPLIPKARQRRALIAHWYTPPYLVDLVDIAPGPETDPAVIHRMRDMVAAMGKAPVVFKQFVPGYVANRIQAAIAHEVHDLLDRELVTPEDIDQSVIHGLALRIPILAILAKADFTGLPLLYTGVTTKSYVPPPVTGESPSLGNLVKAGHTGVMSGKGYFDWSDRSPEQLFRERDLKLMALKQAMREIGPVKPKG